MSKNPLNIPELYALDNKATFWQKLYIHLALEKVGYNMFNTTAKRLERKTGSPYINLKNGYITIYTDNLVCCHYNINQSLVQNFEWWKNKVKSVRKVRYKNDTFLDEQIKNL